MGWNLKVWTQILSWTTFLLQTIYYSTLTQYFFLKYTHTLKCIYIMINKKHVRNHASMQLICVGEKNI